MINLTDSALYILLFSCSITLIFSIINVFFSLTKGESGKFVMNTILVVFSFTVILCVLFGESDKNKVNKSIKNLQLVTVNSQDTITDKFIKCDDFYLNVKDSSKIYIDKIIFEKVVK